MDENVQNNSQNSIEDIDEEYPTSFHWTEGGSSVFLVGNFTKWLEEKVPMKKEENSNVWSTIIHLPVGIHSYKFLVDNEWRFGSDQTRITDENGNINNCLSVTSSKKKENIPKTWSPTNLPNKATKAKKHESEILHNQMLLNGVQEVKNAHPYTSDNFFADEPLEQPSIEMNNGKLVRSNSSGDFGPLSNNDYTATPAVVQHRLMLIMVGLPARGKSCISQKLSRYLNWMGYYAKVFNLGSYRRAQLGAFHSHDFFRPDNPEAVKQRNKLASYAIKDVMKWFVEEKGIVAIFDGTNSTRERRQKILHKIHKEETRLNLVIKAIFVEIICTDPKVIEENIRATKVMSPDYVNVPPDEVVKDFTERIKHYKAAYETITNQDDFRYIKIFDVGRQMVTNRITGFLPSRVMFFLSNLHIIPRQIFLVRHGQSQYNLKKLLGGDSSLTPLGVQFAVALKEFVCSEIDDPEQDLCVWSSTMIRTIQTAEDIPCVQYVRWKALEEIQVGVCDGMTYEEVKEKMPEEFHARSKDKLRYRYPRGESYEDLIRRIEPAIIELERQRKAVLIIAHRAVLRCLYAYFTNLPREEVPHISVPLHTVIKLTPHAYGTNESRFQLMDPIEEE